ncbi:hypothetical protein [Flammeovirga sp. OC4]|uniref:hypothetical protein n=1 Tax=Flammeovirga sp. OC4 TaxID=1382345 RepID=UPI0005C624AF|nr:hypothetical protein [Flammeovirga sp. OC4]
MKLSVSRLELSAKINWGRKHLTSILKKTLPLWGIGTVISFTAIPYPIFETWIKGFTFFGIPSLLYFGSSAIFYLSKSKSKIRCTNEELHIQNGKEEFRIPTQQIAQFYLKYNANKTRNSDQAKVDLMLLTKDNQEFDCFNGKGLPAMDGRELEDNLQQFLGIEDYYVEGEYQVKGHQKESLIESEQNKGKLFEGKKLAHNNVLQLLYEDEEKKRFLRVFVLDGETKAMLGEVIEEHQLQEILPEVE